MTRRLVRSFPKILVTPTFGPLIPKEVLGFAVHWMIPTTSHIGFKVPPVEHNP